MDIKKDAPDGFYLVNGLFLRNALELVSSLRNMDEDTFRHHVNEERNDFSNWIRDTYKNKTLSTRLQKCQDRETLMEVLVNNLGQVYDKEVGNDSAFLLVDGRVLRSIGQLAESLRNMDEDIFRHHVNEERNDFSNWIRDIFENKGLASQVKKCKTRESVLGCLRRALSGNLNKSVLKKPVKKKEINARQIGPISKKKERVIDIIRRS